MKKLSLAIVLSFVCVLLFARAPEKIEIKSESMAKSISNLIVRPDSYDPNGKPCPVIYILHGAGGDFNVWYEMRPDLPELANRMGVIFVMPHGQRAWYIDSPINPNSKYETYVAKELVSYIDKNYNTIKSREGRAITGNSMGGFGALWLAMRNPDVFGACGAQSGGVDIRPFASKFGLPKVLGNCENNKESLDKYAIIENLGELKSANLAIIMDCGYGDFFFKVNENLHVAMQKADIPHDYYVRPGKHDKAYWKNSSSYQFLFFEGFFKKAEGK